MASWKAAPCGPNPGTAENADFQKFTAITVHHLSEPVRMIAVYTEMLCANAGPLNEDGVHSVEFLRKASLQMQKLLDGLAEFGDASSKSSRPPSILRLDLPLRQALQALEDELKPAAARVSYSGLPTVSGDFDRLQIVFRHLIRNAVIYCADRPPDITIQAQPAGCEWVVSVSDNGPGIEPAFMDRIFEPYTRLHGKSIPGNGLGLAICRAIVEGHGGRMWVESKPGEGASFFFTIPFHEDIS